MVDALAIMTQDKTHQVKQEKPAKLQCTICPASLKIVRNICMPNTTSLWEENKFRILYDIEGWLLSHAFLLLTYKI